MRATLKKNFYRQIIVLLSACCAHCSDELNTKTIDVVGKVKTFEVIAEVNISTSNLSSSLALADPLSLRLSDASFGVYVACGEDRTNSIAISNYDISSGAVISKTVSALCSTPDIRIENLTFTYADVNQNDVVITPSPLENWNFTHPVSASTIALERTSPPGLSAEYRLHEFGIDSILGTSVLIPNSSGLVDDLAVGGNFACVLLRNKSVKCWGSNFTGELGQGDKVFRGDNPNEMGKNLPPIDLGNDVVKISVGSSHACAILIDSSLKCWGGNGSGQLGQGDRENRGDGANEMGFALAPIDLGTGLSAVQIVSGVIFNCALLSNGLVKCWGENDYGVLGIVEPALRGDRPGEMGDNLPFVNLGTGRTVTQISAGAYHNCAILDNGTLKCWGRNDSGQLGQGHNVNIGDRANRMGDNLLATDLGEGRTAIKIALGDNSTCALLDDHSVKCWGSNVFGDLGNGTYNSVGSYPNEMGDNLQPINLGTGRTATQISASCAILDDQTSKCWGRNSYGQLGLGHKVNLGNQSIHMGDNLPAIDLGVGKTAVKLQRRSCAVLNDASVKCWGINNYGQLGLGDQIIRGDGPGEMGDNLPALEF